MPEQDATPLNTQPSQMPTPSLVTGHLIQLVRHMFLGGRTMYRALENLVYSKDDTVRTIDITTSLSWRPEEASNRPAIGPWQGMHPAVGSKTTGSRTLIGDQDPFTGATISDTVSPFIVQGQHAIRCISSSGRQAEMISEEVGYRLLGLKPKLPELLGVSAVTQISGGEPSAIDGVGQRTYVDVVFGWRISSRSVVRTQSPLLQRAVPDVQSG